MSWYWICMGNTPLPKEWNGIVSKDFEEPVNFPHTRQPDIFTRATFTFLVRRLPSSTHLVGLRP
jgi:hypothetical protein